MNSRIIFFILIFSSFHSCISKDDPGFSNTIPSTKWTSLHQLEGLWTELERDSIGHLLYEPCDGSTPRILISKDSVVLKHQIEMPTRLKIDQYDISGKKITILASSGKLKYNFIFKIIESHSKLIICKWSNNYGNNGKEVLTTEIFKNEIRRVKDSCDIDKIPNQQFLPVEYE